MSAKKNNTAVAKERSARHDSFVIERVLDASPAQVFAAWADPAAKARWFVGPDTWKQIERVHDFRVGGRDRVSGTHAGGMVSTFNALYQDIVPDRRIVYVYDMDLDGTRISVSLATIEFKAAGACTRMTVTEQGVFLDDFDDAGGRERGTNELMDKLAASLRNASPAPAGKFS